MIITKSEPSLTIEMDELQERGHCAAKTMQEQKRFSKYPLADRWKCEYSWPKLQRKKR